MQVALLQLLVALDLQHAHFTLLADAGQFGAAAAFGAELGHLGFAFGTQPFDLAALQDFGFFLLTLDDQHLLDGIKLALPHRHIGIGFDGGALLLVGGHHFGQAAQTHGVEGIVIVDGGKGCLVKAAQGHGFQAQAVLRQAFGHQRLHFAHIAAAIFMQVIHGFACRHALHRVNQAAFDQIGQILRPECLAAQSLGGGGDAIGGGCHPHGQFHFDINPQAVAGDQRLGAVARHFDARGLHIDFGNLMQERQRQAATIHHHALAAGTGADQGGVAGCLAVESVEEQNHHGQHHHRDDQIDDPGHADFSPINIRQAKCQCQTWPPASANGSDENT